MSASAQFYAEGKHFSNILDQTVWRSKQQKDVKSRKTVADSTTCVFTVLHKIVILFYNSPFSVKDNDYKKLVKACLYTGVTLYTSVSTRARKRLLIMYFSL